MNISDKEFFESIIKQIDELSNLVLELSNTYEGEVKILETEITTLRTFIANQEEIIKEKDILINSILGESNE